VRQAQPAASEPDSTRRVFRGRLLSVDAERWPSGEREVVHHPGACAVVARTADGEVVLVRQFREAVRRPLLEIPAGIFDVAGEDGAGCAAGELLEETGYRAVRLELLASIYTSPGFADERIELFLAEAEREGQPGEDGIEVVTMPLDQATQAIDDGWIVDAKTVVGLLLAAARGRDAPASRT
jgi:ADP-ribose pyrophosphatase